MQGAAQASPRRALGQDRYSEFKAGQTLQAQDKFLGPSLNYLTEFKLGFPQRRDCWSPVLCETQRLPCPALSGQRPS